MQVATHGAFLNTNDSHLLSACCMLRITMQALHRLFAKTASSQSCDSILYSQQEQQTSFPVWAIGEDEWKKGREKAKLLAFLPMGASFLGCISARVAIIYS